MNEFTIVKNYLKPLAYKNSNSLALNDDIFYDRKKRLAISVDSFTEGVHFLTSSRPRNFVKKILRSSLSDLYCKGVLPKSYFLSLALSKKCFNHTWLNELKKTLNSEQNKFNIFLGGGDTIRSTKLVITITVIGYAKSKIILRNGSNFNDDIYVTGNIGDSFLGLSVIKKKNNFGSYNHFFKKKYYEPDLASKFSPYLSKIATSSIDVSDGIAQDLQHICKSSKCGAIINLNNLPVSAQCKKIISNKKINLINIFSNGDDYQILFTSNRRSRKRIVNLSKKLNIKISKIGYITKDKNIFFNYNKAKFKLPATKMGYTHTF